MHAQHCKQSYFESMKLQLRTPRARSQHYLGGLKRARYVLSLSFRRNRDCYHRQSRYMKLGNSGYGYSSIVVITTLHPHCHSAVWCAPQLYVPPGSASRGVRARSIPTTVSKGPYKCEKNHFERVLQIEFKTTLEFLIVTSLFKIYIISVSPASLPSRRNRNLFSRDWILIVAVIATSRDTSV